MSKATTLIAALSGILIYCVAVVYLGGVLSAVAISKSYFSFFGREHLELANALLNLVLWALPVFVAVLVLFLLTFFVLRSVSIITILAFVLGMVSSFLYRHSSFALFMANQPTSTLSFTQVFLSTILPYWWAAPNVLAPWFGLVVGTLLATKSVPARAPREA